MARRLSTPRTSRNRPAEKATTRSRKSSRTTALLVEDARVAAGDVRAGDALRRGHRGTVLVRRARRRLVILGALQRVPDLGVGQEPVQQLGLALGHQDGEAG